MHLIAQRDRSALGAVLSVVALVCLSFCLFSRLAFASDEAPRPGSNLAVNPSFEQADQNRPLPAAWYGPSQVYRVDRQTARSGQASLGYANDDPQRYVLATQKVPLEPGRKYQFSVWVKTEGISGDEAGATISMEWQGKDGKWLGGSYPSGAKGTQDWTQVMGVTRVPKEAASSTVLCYVRKGMTGTAWFDDVEVVRVVDPPMRSALLAPIYRGRMTAEKCRVHLSVNQTLCSECDGRAKGPADSPNSCVSHARRERRCVERRFR